MKAVIMEIHKDYCIAVTRDGQFLKRKIPQGVFEIGDEIVIDLELAYKTEKAARPSWVGRFVATASIVVVIVVGIVIGVRFIRGYYSSEGEAVTAKYEAEEKLVAEDEEAGQAFVAREAEEEEEAAAVEDKEGTVVYKDIYFLNEENWVEERVRGVVFSYRVVDGTDLQIRLVNQSSTPYFNGIFNLFMLLSDKSESRIISIPVEEFEPGDIYGEVYLLKEGETSFKLEVFEEF